MNDRMTATRRTAARTRWLAELAEALEIAGKVALELGDAPDDGAHAALLRRQIESLRSEVDSLRRARPVPTELHPDWTSHGAARASARALLKDRR